MRMGGGGTLKLTWLSPRRLLVEYPEEATLRLAAPGWPAYATDIPDLRVVYRGSSSVASYSASVCLDEAASAQSRMR
jgi:hypothetical protein